MTDSNVLSQLGVAVLAIQLQSRAVGKTKGNKHGQHPNQKVPESNQLPRADYVGGVGRGIRARTGR
jgi:hypothetical protein